MKKLLILISMLFIGSYAYGANIDILPTMQSKSNVQDRVWVGTFQIVWNDLMDKLANGEVKFFAGNPDSANELNKREFTTSDVSDKCYYKYFGKISANTKKTIEDAIKKKFNEKSDILDKLNWTPGKGRYIIYAMLKKDFEFLNAFDKLGQSDFRGKKAEFFGINRGTKDKLREGVHVLFYNSPSEYAVKLDTTSNDEVYLFKTSTTNTFKYIYEDMLKKEKAFKGNKKFAKIDMLKVPNLKFFEEKEFKELCGKHIKGTKLEIDQALETVKFEMDNKGVKLKSEAVITTKLTSIGPGRLEHPRYFYFDDTFVLFLKEKGKSKPYFALRVYDISKFE